MPRCGAGTLALPWPQGLDEGLGALGARGIDGHLGPGLGWSPAAIQL